MDDFAGDVEDLRDALLVMISRVRCRDELQRTFDSSENWSMTGNDVSSDRRDDLDDLDQSDMLHERCEAFSASLHDHRQL
jgi:hypothetical protein